MQHILSLGNLPEPGFQINDNYFIHPNLLFFGQ